MNQTCVTLQSSMAEPPKGINEFVCLSVCLNILFIMISYLLQNRLWLLWLTCQASQNRLGLSFPAAVLLLLDASDMWPLCAWCELPH